MAWSHYDKDANVAMLRKVGFELRYAESRTGVDKETWLWVLAHKRPAR